MRTSEKIKTFRKKSNLTQKQLAEKSNIAEITIRKYEKGDRIPKLEQLTKIAAALECSPVDLLADDANMFQTWDAEYDSTHMAKDVKTIELLEKYESLNEDGRKAAIDYINYLAEQPKYKEGE